MGGAIVNIYTAVAGQSLYDICLHTYGSLDMLYKLMQDNQITDINEWDYANQRFIFDNSLIKDRSIIQENTAGIRYITKADTDENGILYDDTILMGYENGAYILYE